MACPTCDCTMQRLEGEYFWCPRCGTIRNRAMGVSPSEPFDDVPKLVERCRIYRRHYATGAPNETLRDLWQSLGIAESINLPADRPA